VNLGSVDNLLTEPTYATSDLVASNEATVYHFCIYEDQRAKLNRNVGWNGASSLCCVYRHPL
jgi:hypothetical protein